METLNSLLSNDIGYLHALRYAQPLPTLLPTAVGNNPVPKKSNLISGILIFSIVIFIIVSIRNSIEKQLKAQNEQ